MHLTGLRGPLTAALAGFLVLSAAPALAVDGGGQPQPPRPTVDDAIQQSDGPTEILVRYGREARPAFDSADQRALRADLNDRVGVVAVREVASSAIAVVRTDDGTRVDEAIRELEADPAVASAEPNSTYSTQQLPDDQHLTKQWALDNTGQTGGSTDADIDAPEAWDVTTGSRDVVVVVIDTGIDFRHPDLAANIWTNPGEVPGDGRDNDHNGYVDDVHGYDVVDGDGRPSDPNGHGTHVAGTIGALGDNGIGVAGVAWRVQIAACRFLDEGGEGTTDGAIACLDYVKALQRAGVNVIATNNSWSGVGRSALLRRAINHQHEVLFVAAAGNSGNDIDTLPAYPAAFELPNVLAVGATDDTDHLAGFSNRGQATVGLTAPGVDIVSLRAAGTDLNGDGGESFVPRGNPDAKYYRASGTSMAAPHVTGVAALLKARYPGLDTWGIRNRILAGADTVAWLEGSTVTGRRLNAAGALRCRGERVLSPVGRQPTFPLPADRSVTFRVLNIDCAEGAGPVTATTSLGTRVRLRDDGRAPDRAAHDGLYAGSFRPTSDVGWIRLTSHKKSVTLPGISFSSYLPGAQVGTPYSLALKPFGASGALDWSVVDGALPDGVTLDRQSGVLTGTPTTAGHSRVALRLVDARGRSAVANVGLEVSADSVVERLLAIDRIGPPIVPEAQAVDADGNTVVAGHYTDPRTHDEDVAVTKYSPTGEILWRVLRASDTAWWANWAFAVAVDDAGNSYVASGYPFFRQDSDIVVVKYDPDGNELWSTSYSDNEVEVPLGMTLDPAGDIIVTGLSTLGANTSALTVKLHSDGQLVWARKFRDGVIDRGSDVATDPAGNVYVAGGTGFVFASIGGFDFFSHSYLVLKYAPNGDLLWSRFEHDPAVAHLQIADAIVVDADGNSYLGGPLGGQLTKLDTDGNPVWEGPPTIDHALEILDLVFDADGDVVVGGYFWDAEEEHYTSALATVSPSGTPGWFRRLSGDSDSVELHLSVDAEGTLRATRASDHGTVLTSFRSSPTIRTDQLPDALRGEVYEHRLRATGGARPLTWGVTAGELPAGLSLDPGTGVIAGTPTTGGPSTFTVTATARTGESDSRELSLLVQDVIVDGSPGTAVLEVGQPWQLTDLSARGSAPPFTWGVASGELPPGLTVAPQTGVVSGTPTLAGSYDVSIGATDADGHSGTTSLTFTVVDPLVLVTTTLPDAVSGQAYTASLVATGGRTPYSWGWYGTPVPGLEVDNQTGLISGVPDAPGTYETGVFVMDTRFVFTTRALTLVVN